MARKRLISPEFFTHGELYDAERASGLPLRLAFAGLWTASDRRGLFIWKPRELKLAILPYDDVDFGSVLDALEAAGFIRCYVVDGKEYGSIPSFAEWQTFHHHEKESAVPDPSEGEPRPDNGGPRPSIVRRNLTGTVTVTGTVTRATPSADGTARPEPPRSEYSPAFESFWAVYPPRAGGNSKKNAWSAWCARLRAGVPAEVMHAGAERYAAFSEAEGNLHTRFVMMAKTFLGTGDLYLEPWEPGKPKGKPEPALKIVDGWFAA